MTVFHTTPDEKQTMRARGKGLLIEYTSSLGTIPVLHVVGAPSEMGWQCGALAGDMIRRVADRLVGLFSEAGLTDELVFTVLDRCWKRLEPHAPARFLEEMAAVAAGARDAGHDISLEDLQRITTVTNFDLYKREQRIIEFLGEDAAPLFEKMNRNQNNTMSCTMFAVWGSRTVDGKLFSDRDLDWVSQTGLHEDKLITVYHPESGHAFVSTGFAGVMGPLAGMNDAGITLSEVGAFSVSEELDGTPWIFIARRVLEESDCLSDAVDIIQNEHHTIGYNYLIADGDPDGWVSGDFTPGAAVFETNFECCEAFYENEPKEKSAIWTDPAGNAHHYGLPLPEAVMRSDMAFGQRTRALQVADNGPGEPENDGNPLAEFPGNTYIECHKPMHDIIRAYETGAEYVYPLRGTKVVEAGPPRLIGPEEALEIAATVAHNVEKLHENDWDIMSVVYAPTDLEFWVAYEACDENGNWKNAPDSGYWHFDARELFAGPG